MILVIILICTCIIYIYIHASMYLYMCMCVCIYIYSHTHTPYTNKQIHIYIYIYISSIGIRDSTETFSQLRKTVGHPIDIFSRWYHTTKYVHISRALMDRGGSKMSSVIWPSQSPHPWSLRSRGGVVTQAWVWI